MPIKTIPVKWEYEDQIEPHITEATYKMSRVHIGVRMYPYVMIEGERHYLQHEEEKQYGIYLKGRLMAAYDTADEAYKAAQFAMLETSFFHAVKEIEKDDKP